MRASCRRPCSLANPSEPGLRAPCASRALCANDPRTRPPAHHTVDHGHPALRLAAECVPGCDEVERPRRNRSVAFIGQDGMPLSRSFPIVMTRRDVSWPQPADWRRWVHERPSLPVHVGDDCHVADVVSGPLAKPPPLRLCRLPRMLPAGRRRAATAVDSALAPNFVMSLEVRANSSQPRPHLDSSHRAVPPHQRLRSIPRTMFRRASWR